MLSTFCLRAENETPGTDRVPALEDFRTSTHEDFRATAHEDSRASASENVCAAVSDCSRDGVLCDLTQMMNLMLRLDSLERRIPVQQGAGICSRASWDLPGRTSDVLSVDPSALSHILATGACGGGPSGPLPALALIPPAQAITLLASQLSTFGGLEEEDIELWLNKVERLSIVHGVAESIRLFAATNKLTKHARDWFEMCDESVIGSWSTFKIAIIKRFRRHASFASSIQKIEACKWNFGKESFMEYASQKLKLMHPLQLLPRDPAADFGYQQLINS